MQTQLVSFLMPLTALQTSIGLRFVTARGFPGDQRRLLSLQHVPGSSTGVVSTSRVHFKDIPTYLNLPLAYQGIKTKVLCTNDFPWTTYVARSAYGNPRITVEMRLYFQDCYCGEQAPDWMEDGDYELVDIWSDCFKKNKRTELDIQVPSGWISGIECNVSCTSVVILYEKEQNVFRQLLQRNLIRQLKANLKAHFAQILVSFKEWDTLTLEELCAREESAIGIKQCMYGSKKSPSKA